MNKNEMGGKCSTYGRQVSCIDCFGVETCEREPHGRPSSTREDNIKIDLQGVGWECMDWSDVVQDRDRWRFL